MIDKRDKPRIILIHKLTKFFFQDSLFSDKKRAQLLSKDFDIFCHFTNMSKVL